MARRLVLLVLLVGVGLAGALAWRQFAGEGDRADNATPPVSEDPGVAPQEELRTLLGLSVGRRWEYAGEGNEYATYSALVTHASRNRYQLEENNGGTVVARVIELRADGAFEILTREEFYTSESLLQSEAVEKRDPRSDEKLLPWPLRAGTKWRLPDGAEASLVSTRATLTTPFRTFADAVRVRIVRRRVPPANEQGGKEEVTTQDRFYVPDVGLVERRFQQGDVVIASRLAGVESKEGSS